MACLVSPRTRLRSVKVLNLCIINCLHDSFHICSSYTDHKVQFTYSVPLRRFRVLRQVFICLSVILSRKFHSRLSYIHKILQVCIWWLLIDTFLVFDLRLHFELKHIPPQSYLTFENKRPVTLSMFMLPLFRCVLTSAPLPLIHARTVLV